MVFLSLKWPDRRRGRSQAELAYSGSSEGILLEVRRVLLHCVENKRKIDSHRALLMIEKMGVQVAISSSNYITQPHFNHAVLHDEEVSQTESITE